MAEARGEEDGEQDEEEAETSLADGTLSPGGGGDPLQPAVQDLQCLWQNPMGKWWPRRTRIPRSPGSREVDLFPVPVVSKVLSVPPGPSFALILVLCLREHRRSPFNHPSSSPSLLALARLCEDENKQPLHHDVQIAGDVRSLYRFQERSPSHQGWQTPPASQDKGPGEIVNELFKEAKERGAIPVDEALEECSKMKLFSGGGYKLGDSVQERSEYVFGEYQQEFADDAQILLKLWKNGFSLDDGDLRPYTEEANAEFLDCIKRGEIPSELRRLVHGDLVHLDMEDHQDQEYERPRLRFKAFSGEGQKLGSLTPEIVSTPSSPEEERKVFFNAEVVVDEFEPTTRIQIRLADGSRLIQRFNLTHRIADIRHFITESRPAFESVDFVLVTTFPNKELVDENLTLEEADVLNTVILQRLK